MKLLRLYLAFSLVFTTPVYGYSELIKLPDGSKVYEIKLPSNVTELIPGEVYPVTENGQQVLGVYEGIVEHKGIKQRYFSRYKGDISDLDQGKFGPINKDLKPGKQQGPGPVDVKDNTTSGEDGNASDTSDVGGSEFGVGDAVGFIGTAHGAISNFNGVVDASNELSGQLRKINQTNLDSLDYYSDKVDEHISNSNKVGNELEGRAGSNAGTKFSGIKNRIYPKEKDENRNVRGGDGSDTQDISECKVSIPNGTFINMPPEFFQAYLNKDINTLSKYIEGLSGASDKALSEFCKNNIKLITNFNGLIDLAKIQIDLPKNPIADYNFKTDQNSNEGALIRKIGNKYLADWFNNFALENATPQKVHSYMAGMANLVAADTAFSQENTAKGLARATASELLLNIGNGFVDGVSEATNEIAKTLPELAENIEDFADLMASDPYLALKKANEIIKNIPEIADQIHRDILTDWDVLKNGSAYERSKLLGRIAVDVTTDYISGGTARFMRTGSKVFKTVKGKSSKVANSLNKVKDKLHLDDYGLAVRGKALDKTSGEFIRGIPNLKFTGKGTWVSKAGLKYGKNYNHRTTLRHVLKHSKPDPTKPIHTVFKADIKQIPKLIDKAWLKRGKGLIQKRGNIEYIINMKPLTVGTLGENKIKIIIKNGTKNEIVTAFPTK